MLALRKPFRTTQLSNIFDVFDEVFDYETTFNTLKYSKYDVIENDSEFLLEIHLPGVKKENIKVNVEKNELSVIAERTQKEETKFNRKETMYGKFEKTFKLPELIDWDKINAGYVDGVLNITIPKQNNRENKIVKSIEIF